VCVSLSRNDRATLYSLLQARLIMLHSHPDPEQAVELEATAAKLFIYCLQLQSSLTVLLLLGSNLKKLKWLSSF
jgi:hypothetical protein